jgi:hypothetical protein
MPFAAPPRAPRSWLRPVRLAVLTLGAALAVGCSGDDDDGPSGNINGSYSLTQINGRSVPVAGIEGGELTLDDDQYELTLVTDEETFTESGDFERDGSRLNFSSDEGDEFSATLSNSNRVITYVEGNASLRFERQ